MNINEIKEFVNLKKNNKIMREILFGGKQINGDKWIQGSYLKRIFGNTISYEIWKPRGTVPVDINTLGQFTGLTDKNGVRIFEGDILCNRYEDAQEGVVYYEVYNEVAFRDGAFGIIEETSGKLISFSDLLIINGVVAGNIHDNPGLLKLNYIQDEIGENPKKAMLN